jgi:hypothetical protein
MIIICLTGLIVYSLYKVANENNRRERINVRLKELGLENYSWDISEIDDEVIQSILAERK